MNSPRRTRRPIPMWISLLSLLITSLLLLSYLASSTHASGPVTFSPRWFSAESEDTYAVAWGDVDGDGDLDLIAGNDNAHNRLYLNQGQELEPHADWWSTDLASTTSVAWGDVDGDGDLDLAVGNYLFQANQIFINNKGTLANSAAWSSDETDHTYSVAWGDIDSDGDLDLAVGNGCNPVFPYDCYPSRLYSNDNGILLPVATWSTPVADATYSVAWGDVDGDGDLDLAVGNGCTADISNPTCDPNRLYLNDNGILQTPAAWTAPFTDVTYSVAWGDVDGDGDLDLAVGNGCTEKFPTPTCRPSRLYRNDNGTLSSNPVWSSDDSANTYDVEWGDIDGDGDLDLVAANKNEPNRAYLNDNGMLQTQGTILSSDSDDSTSAALGDMDGDGDLDLAIGNTVAEQNKVYLNLGGTMQTSPDWNSPLRNSSSIAWGDVDGDGDLDLAIGNGTSTGQEDTNEILLNQNGVLETSSAWSPNISDATVSMAWGDVDGDGDLDLAVGNHGSDFGAGAPNLVYLNDGTMLALDPAWTSDDSDHTYSVAWADVDGDGDLDLAVGNYGTWDNPNEPNKIYFNNNGSLSTSAGWVASSADETHDIAWGDVDGDGDLDLAVAGYRTTNRLYLNERGTLATSPDWYSDENDWSTSVAWGDVDGDGDLDLAVGDEGQQNKVYLNQGGYLEVRASWRSLDTDWTQSVAWGDVDGDGDLDLVTGAAKASVLRVYLNKGDGLEDTASWVSDPVDDVTAVAWGDLNGDGAPDLAVATIQAKANLVYLNQRPADPYHPGQAASIDLSLYSDPANTFAGTSSALAPADFYAVPAVRESGTIPITYTLFNPNGAPFQDVHAFYSPDGGGQWYPTIIGYNTITTTIYTASAGLPLTIPDVTTVTAVLTVSNPNNVSDLDIWLSISHTWDSDLVVYLESPEGTRVLLFAWIGWDGDDFSHTWFDDEALTSIEDGSPPFRGSYQPMGDLSNFDDEPINGAWKLIIADYAYGDVGTLQGWGLRLSTGGLPPTASAAGQGAAYLSRSGLPTPIPDASWFSATLTITDPYQIADLDVWLGITHTWANDLQAYLRSPAGTQVQLFTHVGGDGDNFSGTWFNDEATTAIGDGSAPFAGVYRPEGNLSDLDGQALNGTWSLWIEDSSPSESGTLWGWGLRIRTPSPEQVYNWNVLDSGFLGHSDNVVVRLEAIPDQHTTSNGIPGPYQRPFVSAQTYPFRVRGNQIRVFSGTLPVANALVYRIPIGQLGGAAYADNTGKPFRTDIHGYLQGRGQLRLGDRLVALLPISNTEKYVLYYTNATPTPTGLNTHIVTQMGLQTLTVSPANPLVVFDLDISLQWDARQDTDYISLLEFNLQQASETLYDWSDGQMALGEIQIYHAREEWSDADIRIYASNRLRPNANKGGIISGTLTDTTVPTLTYIAGHIHMAPTWNRYGDEQGSSSEDWTRTLIHEFGHYGLFLDDNYLGLDENGLLTPIYDCSGAMSDPYREDYPYGEFHIDDLAWQQTCSQTLSQLTTGRADWETITTFYPWLDGSGGNSGPGGQPLQTTHIRFIESELPTDTLQDPTFYLSQNGQSVEPGDRARAFLFQEDWLTDLGRPVGDVVLARGAKPGDRLCVIEIEAQRLGCETVSANDQSLELVHKDDWQPDVIIDLVTTRTVVITVVNVPPSLTLGARYYPIDGFASKPSVLEWAASGYTGYFTSATTLESGHIHVWVDEPDPRRETVTEYALGGNPGPGQFGWPAGGTRIQDVNTGNVGVSVDGQVILFGNLNLPDEEFVSLQTVTTMPPAPPWTTVVGHSYRLLATPNVPELTNTSITFMYLSREVPDGEESWLRIYYWTGSEWQRLSTTLSTQYNTATAQAQGEGLYALMSSIEIPLQQGWNLFAYPVEGTRAVTESLLSIQGAYTLVYGYDIDDPADPWKVYAPHVPGWVNDMAEFEFGCGYWISTTQAITLFLKGSSGQTLDRGVPNPPTTYYGSVQASPYFTPTPGMAVTAWVGSHLCGQGQTLEDGGQVMYVISVSADDGTPGHIGCGVPGRQVRFQVAGQAMAPMARWDNGRIWRLPLQPNAAPVAVDDSATTAQDTTVAIDVLANDSDPDPDDVLALDGLGQPAHGSAAISGTLVVYTPSPGYYGYDNFSYAISDGVLTDSASVWITVTTAANRPPEAQDDSVATPEDTAIIIDVLANDSDPDPDDLLTLDGLGQPAHGSAAISGTLIVYTPTQDYYGADTFTYVVSDGSLTDTAAVNVTIAPINDPPNAADDTATTPEDTPVLIAVLDNDTDPDGDDPLIVVTVGHPSNGRTSSDGATVTYTPTLDFFGTDSFIYVISDGDLLGVAIVMVTVSPVNDAPIAANDAYTTSFETTLVVPSPGVLANDIDVESDILTTTLDVGPTTGTLLLDADGSFVYTPTLGWSGVVTFSYRASDGIDPSNLAVVTIEVYSPQEIVYTIYLPLVYDGHTP